MMNPAKTYSSEEMSALKRELIVWCNELGFQQAGVADIDLSLAETRLADWLRSRFHGSMDYMDRHGSKRSRPELLVPGHTAGDLCTHGLPARGSGYRKALARRRLDRLHLPLRARP